MTRHQKPSWLSEVYHLGQILFQQAIWLRLVVVSRSAMENERENLPATDFPGPKNSFHCWRIWTMSLYHELCNFNRSVKFYHHESQIKSQTLHRQVVTGWIEFQRTVIWTFGQRTGPTWCEIISTSSKVADFDSWNADLVNAIYKVTGCCKGDIYRATIKLSDINFQYKEVEPLYHFSSSGAPQYALLSPLISLILFLPY